MVRVEDIDVDQIWRSVGPMGKYQVKQISSYLCMCISWVIHQLTIVFIGFRPNFQCKPLNDSTTLNSSTVWRDYEQCSIKTYNNETGVPVKVSETGCENGWQYDIPKEQSFVTEWDFVCENAELAELTQTLLTIGMMIGTFVFPTISDRYGRKPVMVGTHMLLFGVVIGTAFSPNYYVFVVLRILTGALSMGSLSGTTLALESFPTEVRFWEEIFALTVWTTAICIMSPIAFALRNESWRYLQITYALLSVWSIFQWWMLDESLRWVIANGKIQKAKQILKNACKWNKKDYATVVRESGLTELFAEANEMNANAEKSPKALLDKEETSVPTIVVENVSLIEMFRNSQIRKVTLIMWFLWITDSLVYYGLFMISSDLYGDRYINFFLSAILEYPACAYEAFALNRIGRKWTSLTCHLAAAVGLILATGFIYGAGDNTAMLSAGTAFTLVGKMAITGAFSSAFILTPELYPTNMRNTGLGAASFMGKVGAMIAPFFRNAGEKVPWIPGFVFAIMCLITVILLAFVPETNGINLPQSIDELTEWYKVNKFSLHIGKNVVAEEKKRPKGEGHETVPLEEKEV